MRSCRPIPACFPNAPPANPNEGDCWLVGDNPAGAWAGHGDNLACFQSGNWLFAAPRAGLTIFDQTAGQIRRYVGGWQAANSVAAPVGGTVVDVQARSAVAGLVAALIAGGVLPST